MQTLKEWFFPLFTAEGFFNDWTRRRNLLGMYDWKIINFAPFVRYLLFPYRLEKRRRKKKFNLRFLWSQREWRYSFVLNNIPAGSDDMTIWNKFVFTHIIEIFKAESKCVRMKILTKSLDESKELILRQRISPLCNTLEIQSRTDLVKQFGWESMRSNYE